jgi:hypothetical protein
VAILLLTLALGWCAYLLPVAMRRRASRPSAIGDYRRSLSRLSDVGGSAIRSSRSLGPSRSLAAARARRSRKRRRDVFLGLAATALGTFVLGLLPSLRPLLGVSAAVTMTLGLYSLALVRRNAPAAAPARRFAPAYAARFTSWDDDGFDDRFDDRGQERFDLHSFDVHSFDDSSVRLVSR